MNKNARFENNRKIKKKHSSVTAINDSFASQSLFPTIEKKDLINKSISSNPVKLYMILILL